MIDCIVVGAGGFIGAVCRYLIGLIPLNEGGAFPVKTFLINIAGSFVIGIIAALALKNSALNPRAVLLETGDLIKGGNMQTALAYVVLSTVLGVLAVFAGQAVVRG